MASTPSKAANGDAEQRHVISVLVENRFGVLSRVSGHFAGRGFNIDSLNVGTTKDPSMSRMTIVVKGDARVLDQVRKQLHRLPDVIEVQDFTDADHVDRELILVKVQCGAKERSELMQIADVFRARIVDVGVDCIIIESTGAPGKIEAILNMLEPFGILELVRTGRIALARGPVTIHARR